MTTLDAYKYWMATAAKRESHDYWMATAATVAVKWTQEEDEHSKHQFGLCDECGCGLDDKSEFVLHEMTGGEIEYLCIQCWHSPCPWSS